MVTTAAKRKLALCGTSGRSRENAGARSPAGWRAAGQRRPSVDVELVAFRVLHRDCVVIEAFGVMDTDEQGTETG
jgi:hypothetical protein